jgi:hypothetical protein
LLVSLCPGIIHAVDKSGIITGIEEWSGSIQITGNITVGQNGVLVINPKTAIKVQGYYSINVEKNGRIIAQGTPADSIVFTPLNISSGWGGITFSEMDENADSSVFQYCRIQHCFRTTNGAAFSVTRFHKLRLSNCRIMNCKNDYYYGAGFYGDSANVIIRDCYFAYNHAGHGGGMNFRDSDPLIENSTFHRNTSQWNAAAMLFYRSNPQIKNCLVTYNEVGSTGGEALYFEESKGTIVDSKILNNENVGICCYHAGITIVNTVIANNTGNYAGGIYLINSHPSINNSTIVNNFGNNAGGINCSFYSRPKIINSIIWNNYGAYNEVKAEQYTPIIVNSDIKEGYKLPVHDSDYINCISKYPLFVNPIEHIGPHKDALSADWSLKPCSPCINRGINDSLPVYVSSDINGFPRIFDNNVDIGAYESQLVEPPLNQRLTLYVRDGGTGNGISWDQAMGNLQEAIDTPFECFEGIDIWLAAGTYYPDTLRFANKRDASLLLKNNVRILGGFNGNESTIEQRNPELHRTVLSGNFGSKTDIYDNSNHVIYASFIDSTAILDGLTVSGGLSADDGAGIFCSYASPTLINMRFEDNIAYGSGGAIYAFRSNSYLQNTLLYNNQSKSFGGGGYFHYSSPRLYNCRIINNKIGNNFDGGGLYLSNSDPLIMNTLITNNISGSIGDGGGIFCQSSDPVIINSTIANNFSNDQGGGIYSSSGSRPVIYNSIFWNNQNRQEISHFAPVSNLSISIKNSIIQGGNKYNIPEQDFQSNIDEDPRFVNPSILAGNSGDALNADWNVTPCSPAIDAGEKTLLAEPFVLDMNGMSRIVNNIIDIGPYENQGTDGEILEKRIIYVKQNAIGDGTSWANATGDLYQAITNPTGCYRINEIWVAAGTYKPDSTGLSDMRNATFRMINKVKVYGGFAGNELSINERDPDKNITRLSGDIGITGDSADNCYHVVTFDKNDTTCILDGFFIGFGNATGNFPNEKGGGIYCRNSDLILSNLVIHNNRAEYNGGGMFIDNSRVEMNHMEITRNTSHYIAGMAINKSTFLVQNCLIYNNDGETVGGISISESRGKLGNCLISNNISGAVASSGSNYAIINCAILNNKSHWSDLSDIRIYSDTLLILNSILWNNVNTIARNKEIGRNFHLMIRNSDVQYGTDIELPREQYQNNIDEDPYFYNPVKTTGISDDFSKADWSLRRCSPCINAGSNDKNYISLTDLANNPRIFNNETIDIGPYEVQYPKSSRPTDIVLSNNTVNKDYELNTAIGKFTAVDSDSHDFLYTFSPDPEYWSYDSVYFKIKADSLYAENPLPINKQQYYFVVRVTDYQECELEKPFTIINSDLTGIEKPINQRDVLVYPNPTTGPLYISIGTTTSNTASIRLYDVTGKVVLNKEIVPDDLQPVDLSNLNSGSYILVITQRDDIYRKSVILY